MSYVAQRLSEIRNGEITKTDYYPNVEKAKTRHGRTVYYYRRGKGPRTRLPNPHVVSPDVFREAYEIASTGKKSVGRARGMAPSLAAENGKPGHVYFIRDGHRLKIGFTTNIKSRVKAIQTDCAEAVDVLMVMPGTQGTEKFLHERFADYHVGGEWFNLVGTLADFCNYRCPR